MCSGVGRSPAQERKRLGPCLRRGAVCVWSMRMETDTLNKVQDVERINDTRKAELLSTPIEHIDITKFDARPIIDAMGKMSFTSRDLARATGIYNTMLEDKDCSIILVIAGSTSAGGCMDVYAELVKRSE